MEDKEKRGAPQERLAGRLHGDAWNVWFFFNNNKKTRISLHFPELPLGIFYGILIFMY